MTKDGIVRRIKDENLALISIGSHRARRAVYVATKPEAMYCWTNAKNYYLVPQSALPQLLAIKGVKRARPRENCTMCWGE